MLRFVLPACLIVGISALGAEPAAAPTLQEISPGLYQIGRIRIDQKHGIATFPAKVNMVEGALEFLLVTPAGPTHESLLSTEVQPSDLHFAMLLLGAKGAGITTPAPGDAPPPQINKGYLAHAPKLKGDTIELSVKWAAGGTEKTTPVEDWILNVETKKAASRGPWIYTGSMFREDRFLAQSEGAFASLVTYPAALINNPRKGSDDDSVWIVNAHAVPPVNTPVEFTIKLQPAIPNPESK